MFSNFPENVDDALRQRAGARFLVDGPQSKEDYIDLLSLLLGKRHQIPLGEHDLFAAQEIKKAVAASYDAHSRPQEEALKKVFDSVQGKIGALDTVARLGAYLKAIQEADERFTGRAIKNITDAIKVRAMDFELPDEWMEKPELFLTKDYATKLAMISELARPIMVEMVIQEINREQKMTVFMVEQDAFHALKLAHRAYVMVTGKITMTGTGAQLLADPEVRSAYLEGGH